MTTPFPTERIFSLPCFEGLRLLRRYILRHPQMAIPELLTMIEQVEADAQSLDLEASVHLSTLVEIDCPLDGHLFYQSCIKAVLVKHQPLWARAMRSGRRRFVQTLDPNDQDVFAAAGLMDDPTPDHVVVWWDAIYGHARLMTDQEKMAQGRSAEILTLRHERERLASLGIAREPLWPGFDDNYAGYDVLSYDHGPTGLQNRLIEVKSTSVSPLRFFLSRGEWKKAEQTGDAYVFHVWDMNKQPPDLHIRTVQDVKPHIPSDNGNGQWNNVLVPVGSASSL